jgi:hypothetical protein
MVVKKRHKPRIACVDRDDIENFYRGLCGEVEMFYMADDDRDRDGYFVIPLRAPYPRPCLHVWLRPTGFGY